MSSLSSAVDISSLEECFERKISALKISKDIRGGWGEDTVTELEALRIELQEIQQEVQLQKQTVAEAKKDVTVAFSLLKQIQNLSGVVGHMMDNLPSHLPGAATSCTNTNKTSKENVPSSNTGKAETREKASHKSGSSRSKHVPVIQYITMEEFDSVSKYIKGRLQYDQVNNAVGEVNKAIETKYTLMSRPRAKLSEFDMKIVMGCKQQENRETKGFYFVVDNDIKRWSGMKLDTAGRSMLTVLRTLKRLREIRGPGNLIRYAVL